MTITHNVPLADLTTFHINAVAETFITYDRNDIDELVDYINKVGKEKRILHIGEGSNLLFLRDFDGIILKSCEFAISIYSENAENVLCRVGGGCNMDSIISSCVQQGFYGLENLSLIPGTVGASAVQNIGAYGVEVCDSIVEVETIELSTGNIRIWKNEECRYSYRHSIFKEPEMWGRYAVLSVTFRLSRTFNPILDYGGLRNTIDPDNVTAEQLREAIIKIRREKLPDPATEGNAGSFFMNPIVGKEKFMQLLSEYPDMPHYPVDDQHEKIPAGWMIDMCGWKGRALGPAAVHNKQALVIVNKGGATGEDIVRLSDTIRRDVFNKFGIEIFPEVNFI